MSRSSAFAIPDLQGAVISFRGKIGSAWLGVRGDYFWYLTRRDAAEQDTAWSELTEEKLREVVGSEFQVLHQGGYERAAYSVEGEAVDGSA